MEPEQHADANRVVYQKLSELVIGHNTAKKVLINLVNRSKLRYYQKWGLLDEQNLVSVTNCLLIGDSGTGKTHLVESLSKIMKFPLLKIDATELNPTGASGGIKQDDLVKKIVKCAKEYMENDPDTYYSLDGTLDQMVVFVDEVDKLGQKLSTDWNEHVQANFLTLFENKNDTFSGVSYIFAGAFTGLEKHNKKTTKLGFTHQADDVIKASDISQDIIKFGLIPEFVGRLNTIVTLDKLKVSDYVTILDDLILPKTAKLLECYGIYNYTISSAKKTALAKDAAESGLGVRSLQSSINKILVDLEFEPDSYDQGEYK